DDWMFATWALKVISQSPGRRIMILRWHLLQLIGSGMVTRTESERWKLLQRAWRWLAALVASCHAVKRYLIAFRARANRPSHFLTARFRLCRFTSAASLWPGIGSRGRRL